MTDEQRASLQRFAGLMEREIDANAAKKGDWSARRLGQKAMIREVLQHAAELGVAISTGVAVDEKSADVANVAWKASELYGETALANHSGA